MLPLLRRAVPAALLLCALFCAAVCRADTPYVTYTVNGYGEVQETQSAYLAVDTVVGFGEERLNKPDDLFIAEDGTIYVADTKNRRILIGTAAGELKGIVGRDVLQSPRGVFVTKDGDIYVADRDAEAVFQFSADGELKHTYTKPESPLYGESLSFLPLKLVVNDAGILFVICESNTNGIVEISPIDGGTFLGYFGTNYASADIRTIIYRAILTEAQRAKMVSNIPATPDNLAIDSRGLIYTVTRGDGMKTVKRLNIAGINLIDGAESVDIPSAIAAGSHHNVYVADQKGFIYEYNSDGELIFVFGGKDDGNNRAGLFTTVTAIGTDPQGRLYVLDSALNMIQVFEPTEFTDLIHEALELYSVGRYTESKEPLEKVLAMNSLFDVANRAMGRAYYQEENWTEAQRYARLAKDREGYSDAFWEIRNEWLKSWVPWVFGGILVLALMLKIAGILRKKAAKPVPAGGITRPAPSRGIARLADNLRYAFRYMRHPIDASYGIAREGRGNWAAPAVLLGIFILEFLVNKYLCGFLQKTVQDGRYEIFRDAGIILAGAAALTLCNYLVCTINDGEGRVKQIFTYICYSLTPYILLTPVSFLLSHVLTINEQFLITLVNLLVYGWTLVLLVLGIREVNNYTAKETAKVIFLTIFTALILALIVFIIYVLWAQVFEFISALFGEAVYRIG
ncbi:MAG: YIP1 family protein [Clostridiales bacterium]|nr:YIP1 family protein [Clostridiales bacterium]